jgi:hypothetical protein
VTVKFSPVPRIVARVSDGIEQNAIIIEDSRSDHHWVAVSSLRQSPYGLASHSGEAIFGKMARAWKIVSSKRRMGPGSGPALKEYYLVVRVI